MSKTSPAAIDADNLLSERFIGDAELCDLLGWARSTPATLRCRGRLPFRFYKVGSSIRYRLADITAHLNQCAVDPKTGNTAA